MDFRKPNFVQVGMQQLPQTFDGEGEHVFHLQANQRSSPPRGSKLQSTMKVPHRNSRSARTQFGENHFVAAAAKMLSQADGLGPRTRRET